jgi:long-subunit acyl-CoA synthetase (AMP-forming)
MAKTQVYVAVAYNPQDLTKAELIHSVQNPEVPVLFTSVDKAKEEVSKLMEGHPSIEWAVIPLTEVPESVAQQAVAQGKPVGD